MTRHRLDIPLPGIRIPSVTFDAHTHCLRRNAVVDIDPVDASAMPQPFLRRGYLYSVGIHPWNVGRVTPRALRLLRALAAEPQVVAIGECGLDPVGGPFSKNNPEKLIVYPGAGCEEISPKKFHDESREEILARQTELLRIHFELSETLGKPMILHIVRAFSEIIALKKLWHPSRPWIIHGFRGKSQLARQLLDHGFYLSFGPRHNPASLSITPTSRLLHESDQMPG